MMRYKVKTILTLLAIALSLLLMGQANVRWKAMTFDNPGSKRLLKTDKSSVYYYRTLPEKGMLLNVADTKAIEIRAFAKDKTSKPQFVLKYNDKRTVYDLKFFSASVNYRIFEPVRITLMPGVKQVELICYDRNTYFRAFKPVTIQKKTVTPPLKIINSAGSVMLSGSTSKKQYYTFKENVPFSFQINKGKAFELYVRAQMTEKKVPVFGLYKNGELVQKVSLSMKRTKSYTSEGVTHYTIGKKMEFPALDKIAVYELRAMTDNLFIGRPVIKKTK